MTSKSIFATVAVTALSLTAIQAKASKPNFVLFIADDCSFYDLGCYGSPDSKTPNIDNFAKEGMLFTQCYQACPMSSPTRHNLYTGVWPVKSGAYPNHTNANRGTLSVVQQLHPNGYKVALIGKSHVGPDSVFPWDLYVPLRNGELNFPAIEKFISDCKKNKTPYCLIVASNQPHTPWNKGDASQFDADKLTVPPIYVDSPFTRERLTHYLGEINFMDAEFGNVLSILNKENDTDNDVVIYLSEQGNSLPFAKWTCYDAGVHSGCIVRWPGHIKPGVKSNALVEYVDILPTVLDIIGVKPISHLDGKSFLGVLKGKTDKHKQYTFSLQTSRGIIAGPDYYGIRSVYDGHYRYIVNLTPDVTFKNTETASQLFKSWIQIGKTDRNARFLTNRYQHRPAVELYDVIKDPFCLNNLAEDGKDHSDIINPLDKALKQWMTDCGDKGQETELEAFKHQPGKKNTNE